MTSTQPEPAPTHRIELAGGLRVYVPIKPVKP